MNYQDIIAKSLQKCATTAFQMHPVDSYFIMEINYEIIVNTIIDDLNSNGYNIIKQQ